jgi:hypothetical protein
MTTHSPVHPPQINMSESHHPLSRRGVPVTAGSVLGSLAFAAPSLEIYGHHSDEPQKRETTILIGLEQ